MTAGARVCLPRAMGVAEEEEEAVSIVSRVTTSAVHM